MDDHADRHNRTLWIKGSPGSGKSTLMKYLYNAHDVYFRDYVVAAYYFHARGADLQKGRLGVLRSLLHQILVQRPQILDRFVAAFPSQVRTTDNQ